MTDEVHEVDNETKEVIADAVAEVVEAEQDNEQETPVVEVAEPGSRKRKPVDALSASHNPLTIPWPSDPQGALMGLKRGGVDAARRINGNPERLKNFERGLRLLLQHARARFDQDTAGRQAARENAVAANQRVTNKTKRQLEARAEELRDAADRAQKQADKYGE